MLLAQMRLGASVEEVLFTATQVYNLSVANSEHPQETQNCPSPEGVIDVRTTVIV